MMVTLPLFKASMDVYKGYCLTDQSSNILYTEHIVPCCRSRPQPTTTSGHYTTCCKSQSSAPEDGQKMPKTCWADLGDQ